MTESIYDSCLLYKHESLEIVEMQTDDTLMLASDAFAEKEEQTIKTVNIMTKKREHLTQINSIKFNETRIVTSHHQRASISRRNLPLMSTRAERWILTYQDKLS